jgi:hypothetical protein
MSKINNIGTYDSILDLWNKHPEGGIEGDYATIGATIYEWDKYQDKWVGATDTSSSDTTSTETKESSQNTPTEQSGNSDTPITSQEINFLGQFNTISDVWEKFPEGGHEGDYVTIGDSEHKYWWNKYTCLWDDTTESGNKDNGEKGNDVTIEGLELNDLGTFASIDDLWNKHPEGGKEGDVVVVGTTKYYWNKYTRQWTDNPITTKTDLPTSVINPDDTPANPEFINDRGIFVSLDNAWQKYPAGGNTGDYITIGDSRYWWNSYIDQWQKEGTSIQSATSKQYVLDGNTEIEGTVKTDEDMNVGRNLNVNGTSNIHGNENISGDQAVKGSQSIEENSKIKGDLTVDGTIHNKIIDDKLDDFKVYEESTRKMIGKNINDGLANGTVKQANYADKAGQADEADGLTKIGLDKTDSRYLRKDISNTSLGKIRFKDGLTVGTENNGITADGNATFNEVQSADYLLDGTGYKFERDSNGNYKLNLKDLYVWGKMIVRELEIRKLSSIGGAVIISPCASTIIKVEKISAGYKCYIKQDDGTTHTTNGWKVGDQAKAQTFNVLKAGSFTDFNNGYYWRTVIEVSNTTDAGGLGYVVLSDTSKDNDSTEPQAGDVIVLDGVNADYYTAKVDSDTSHFPYERSNVILLDSSEGYGMIRIIDHVTDFVHDSENDTVNMSRKGVFIKASSFNFISDDGTEVPPAVNYGPWSAKSFPYYAEVSYSGSLWLCIEKTGAKSTDIPGTDSNVWEEMVAKGDNAISILIMANGSNGNYIRNGQGSIVLNAYIMQGGDDITESIDSNKISWTRNSGNDESDGIWNKSHTGIGRSVTVTASEIFGSAAIDCILSK